MAAEYHYISTWQLSAPIERVSAAISDLEQLSVSGIRASTRSRS
jgi:hypothetical protein